LELAYSSRFKYRVPDYLLSEDPIIVEIELKGNAQGKWKFAITDPHKSGQPVIMPLSDSESF
jgi:hypothetical protein